MQGDPFPLTGGPGHPRGGAAEELARLTGVLGARIPPGWVGNSVRLDDRRVITVRHYIDEDKPVVELGDGVSSAARFLERGSDSNRRTWTIANIVPSSSVPASSLPIGGATEPWQEAVVVGYSTAWSSDYSLEPVIVIGRLLQMPDGIANELGDLIPVDLGDDPERCQGLSGAPVLTRSSPAEPWWWVGLLEA